LDPRAKHLGRERQADSKRILESVKSVSYQYLQQPRAAKYPLYPIGSLDTRFLSLFICDERHLSSRRVIRDLMSLPKQQEQRTENEVTGGDGSFVM
jgi:hypothetical protein